MANSEKSYVNGTSDRPLRYQTIGDAFDEALTKWPDHLGLVVRHQDVRWTWQDLGDKVDQFARGLMALGLGPGERIGIWSPNRWEWTVAQFATARLGLILVNINPAYRLSELEYALNKVACRALITADRFKSSDYIRMLNELCPELAHCEPGQLDAKRAPSLWWIISLGANNHKGMIRFDDVIAMADKCSSSAVREISRELDPDDAINIQFTSGTTGFPKGATLSHFNILNNGFFVGEAIGLTDADRLAVPVPLYHCFGMVMGNLACLTHGSAIVYPSEGFEPGAVLEAVAAEKCTALYGVPTMFIAALEHPDFDSYDLSSLRTGIMAGSPCPRKVMEQVIDRMHMSEVTIAYGMTETSPVSFQSSRSDPVERRVSTVGRIHPHVEVKVIDEDDRVVPRGMTGELCTRGYSVMRGYWDDAEKTAEALDSDGWMHTGDLAVLDDEGYCNIVGRVKDMLIRGGENIYPREIEEFLYQHPKIRDVQVFGIPDKKYGEEICAWICLKDGADCTADEIIEFCRDQIAHYKVPRHIRFIEDYPMTVTGKVQKFKMREAMVEELGLNEETVA